jgi:hypothetical protein
MVIIVIVAFNKKKLEILFFPFSFVVWYLFITLDDIREHIWDRFMNPPLLILVLCTALIPLLILKFINQKDQFLGINGFKLSKMIFISIVCFSLVLVSLTGFAGYQNTQSELDERLPYEDVIKYIKNQWNNDNEKIITWFGPHALWVYANIQNFELSEYVTGSYWPTENIFNATTTEFLDFCNESNVRFIAMPSESFLRDFPQYILIDLIELGNNETFHMVTFEYRQAKYFIWDLKNSNQKS